MPAEAAASEVMIASTEDVIDQTDVTYQTADADDINTIKMGASLPITRLIERGSPSQLFLLVIYQSFSVIPSSSTGIDWPSPN